MKRIIDTDNINQEKILQNLLDYVKTLPQYNDIRDSFNSSTMSVIYQMISGLGTWEFFYFNMLRRETYLSTASKDSSVYTIARTFGYNLNRGTCAKLQIKYNDIPTISLRRGTKIGTYNGLDVVYFDRPRFVEKGDLIEFCVGKYTTDNYTVSADPFNFKTINSDNLSTYIDNDHVAVTSAVGEFDVAKSVEEFVVFGSIADFSNSPTQTTIYLFDKDFGYGVELEAMSNVTVEFLQFNGEEPNLTINNVKIDEGEKWIAMEVLSTGSNPEPVEKVRHLAPLFFSTMRRAVTLKDYTYTASAHSLVRAAIAESISGTPGKWLFRLKSTTITAGTAYTISLDTTRSYTIVSQKGDDSKKLLERIAQRMNAGNWVKAKVQGDKEIVVENADPKIEFDIILSEHFEEPQILTEQKQPPCCSLTIYYIKHNQKRDGEILSLSDSERLAYGKYLQEVKMAGTTIILSPAERTQLQLNLVVKVKAPKDVTDSDVAIADHIKAQTLKILDSKYEFQLGKPFNYAELFADITKITAVFDTIECLPVTAVTSSDTTQEYEGVERNYFVVTALNLKFESE